MKLNKSIAKSEKVISKRMRCAWVDPTLDFSLGHDLRVLR